jgi:hypothetical protein
MRWLVLGLWVSSCCFPDCADERPTETVVGGSTASVSGRATLDGQPVADFDAELCQDTCQTQHVTDGGFRFTGLSAGNCQVFVHTADHHQGRETRYEFETLAPGVAVSNVHIELYGGTFVHGRVLADGQPVGGARVEAERFQVGGCRDCVVQPRTHETVTAADGTYALDGLDSPRGYAIRATAAGWLPNEQPVPADPKRVLERTLDLELTRAVGDAGEGAVIISTDLRGVVMPEEDARLLSVAGVEVQRLGRFVAEDLAATHPHAKLVLERTDGGRYERTGP